MALLAGLAALDGCGSKQPRTPAACLQGQGAFLSALRAAPGPVVLGGSGVPISSCLTANQSAGDLTTVGQSLVFTATELNARGRRDPGGPAPYELGFLLGAANRGAEKGGGIQANLLDRLQSAATFTPPGSTLPASFHRSYASGYAAGQNHG